MSTLLPFEAMQFAHVRHHGQRRKYTHTPYTEHLAEVAGYVGAVITGPLRNEAIAVSWLHDSVEDVGVSFDELSVRFGGLVTRGVQYLTDAEEGNRATRKALARIRLASAPAWVQTIKVADCLSNWKSIAIHDPQFARVYRSEILQLVDVLEYADPRLVKMLIFALHQVPEPLVSNSP